MVRVDAVPEEMLAAAQDEWVDEQPIFVHELMLQELVDEVGTAVHEEVAALL